MYGLPWRRRALTWRQSSGPPTARQVPVHDGEAGSVVAEQDRDGLPAVPGLHRLEAEGAQVVRDLTKCVSGTRVAVRDQQSHVFPLERPRTGRGALSSGESSVPAAAAAIEQSPTAAAPPA